MRLSKKKENAIGTTISNILFSEKVEQELDVKFNVPPEMMNEETKKIFGVLCELSYLLTDEIIKTIREK